MPRLRSRTSGAVVNVCDRIAGQLGSEWGPYDGTADVQGPGSDPAGALAPFLPVEPVEVPAVIEAPASEPIKEPTPEPDEASAAAPATGRRRTRTRGAADASSGSRT